MIKRTSRNWIPFWGDKWLFGSMRQEFNVAERGIWWDLMPIAMKDEGFIRANEDTPYPIQQLAGMLIVPEDLLEKTIEKFIKKGKYTRLKNGTLYITNWNKYCFTDRHMRRFDEETEDTMSGNKDQEGEVADTREEKSRVDKRREEEKDPPHLRIKFNFKEKKWRGILDEDLKRWKKSFPDVDIEYHIFTRMVDWIIINPRKGRKKNYARFINNWLSDEQEKFDLKNAGKRSEEKRAKEWLKEKD